MKSSLSAITSLGGYEITAKLGAGSFGVVYAAMRVSTGQRVALKELLCTSAEALARFKQEFRGLQEVHHPNLVEMQELFTQDERFFISMELVDGTDLLSWARPCVPRSAASDGPGRLDEERLRTALYGVAQGLEALHEHGIVHRDLKPSNIQVTLSGRAVVLDFGLSTTRDGDAPSIQACAEGSTAYMAPEQALDEKVGPAADWYAFGSCLYEGLTGLRPFPDGGALHVMLSKQSALPPAPSTRCGRVAPDLEALCMALMAPAPEDRPSGAEVVRCLSQGRAPRDPPHASLPVGGKGPFTGREDELSQLRDALLRTDRGELSVVLIEGEEGVGKSALVGEFVRRQRAGRPDTWVLRGRCYRNETVPYKAFDGCMDDLARMLRRMPPERCAALLPRRANLVTQLFPVLRGVPALARAKLTDASAEPTARRLEAFAALSALLGKLAEEIPLVVAIDDLQWADAESFRLLRALIEGDPAPMLLLCTIGLRAGLEAQVQRRVDEIFDPRHSRTIHLDGLPRRDCEALAAHLLGPGGGDERLRTIALESGGHPLFLAELVRYASRQQGTERESLTLDAALGARMAGLPPDATRLLALMALSGKPCSRSVLQSALEGASLDAAVRVLLGERLIRHGSAEQLICAHDRVRAVAEGSLTAEQRARLHAQLARALASGVACDIGEEARHWDAAGEVARALDAYERAAAAAMQNLAFSRAEQLYARALSLLDDPADPRTRDLTIARGHALTCAGRGEEAARAYGVAAAASEGEARVRLRVLSAQQLIQSARVEEGMNAARALLAELGVPLPASRAGALAHIAWNRLCIASRGFDAASDDDGRLSSDERLVLDSLHALAMPMGWVDFAAGIMLNTTYLRRAIAAGAPAHMARALAHEGSVRAMQRPDRPDAYMPLLERGRQLAAATGGAAVTARQLFMEATAMRFAGDVAGAQSLLECAQQALQAECPGETWLLTNVRTSLGSARWLLGSYALAARETRAWRKEAEERGDSFALSSIAALGRGASAELMTGSAEAAAAQLSAAMAPWPAKPFALVHFGELIAAVEIELYRGGPSARQWLGDHEERHRAAFLFSTPALGATLHALRASAALAALDGAPPRQRGVLLREARDLVALLSRTRNERTNPQIVALEAQLEALTGDRDRALQQALLAARMSARLGLGVEPGLLFLAGLLEGGATGRTRCEGALAKLRDQGWKDPLRAIAMLIPATSLLDVPARRACSPCQDCEVGGRPLPPAR